MTTLCVGVFQLSHAGELWTKLPYVLRTLQPYGLQKIDIADCLRSDKLIYSTKPEEGHEIHAWGRDNHVKRLARMGSTEKL